MKVNNMTLVMKITVAILCDSVYQIVGRIARKYSNHAVITM